MVQMDTQYSHHPSLHALVEHDNAGGLLLPDHLPEVTQRVLERTLGKRSETEAHDHPNRTLFVRKQSLLSLLHTQTAKEDKSTTSRAPRDYIVSITSTRE